MAIVFSQEENKIIRAVHEKTKGLASIAISLLDDVGIKIKREGLLKAWEDLELPTRKASDVAQLLIGEYYAEYKGNPDKIARRIGSELKYYPISAERVSDYLQQMHLRSAEPESTKSLRLIVPKTAGKRSDKNGRYAFSAIAG